MDNIYLITGSSYYLMEDKIKEIVKDNIYNSFDLNTTEVVDILEEANYFSLFDEKKYIVVKSADVFTTSYKTRGKISTLLKKFQDNSNYEPNDEEKEVLENYNKKFKPIEDYLNNSNPNTVIIFSSYGNPDNKKNITEIIKSKYKYIKLDEPKAADIKKKLFEIFKENKYEADTKCIDYIVKSTKNNYDLSINEAKKVMLYYGKPSKVKLEDVTNITSSLLEDNNFKFVDSIMSKNIKEAFKIYDDLMIQKVPVMMILSMITKEIRYTLIIKRMLKSYDKQEIMKIMKINYDFQYDKYVNYTYQYKEKRLIELLMYLCDNEYKIKRGKMTDKIALQLTIIKICE